MWQEWKKRMVGRGCRWSPSPESSCLCDIFSSSVEGLLSFCMDTRLLPKSHRLIGFGTASLKGGLPLSVGTRAPAQAVTHGGGNMRNETDCLKGEPPSEVTGGTGWEVSISSFQQCAPPAVKRNKVFHSCIIQLSEQVFRALTKVSNELHCRLLLKMLVRGKALYLISSPIFWCFGNAWPLPCANSFVLAKNPTKILIFFVRWGDDDAVSVLLSFRSFLLRTKDCLSLFVAVQQLGDLSMVNTHFSLRELPRGINKVNGVLVVNCVNVPAFFRWPGGGGEHAIALR